MESFALRGFLHILKLKGFLEEVTGKKITEEAVAKAVANSRKASENYRAQLALRKDHDPVTSSRNPFSFLSWSATYFTESSFFSYGTSI